MELMEAAGALLTVAGRTEPHPFYTRLREAPVLVAEGRTLVSRYAECAQGLREPRLRTEDHGAAGGRDPLSVCSQPGRGK